MYPNTQIDELVARVDELEAERDALQDVVREQADALYAGYADDLELHCIERALRAALSKGGK